MHRTHLLSLLSAYHPDAPEEQVYKRLITEFVNEHPNCFERSLAIGHITASSWLIDKAGSAFLLTHHAKFDKWCQLGGHCDGQTNVLDVALREAQEESGIQNIIPISEAIFDIDVHLIPGNRKEAAHYHYDIRFLLQVTSDEEFKISPESKSLGWFSNSLPTKEQSVIRMFEKWKNLNKTNY